MKNNNHKKTKRHFWKGLTSAKLLPLVLVIFGLLGTLASAIILIEKEELLKHPETSLVCNINPIYSCSNVFMSEKASILGFSNEYLGMAVFTALLTLGVTMFAGGTYKRWLWQVFGLGLVAMLGFTAWFVYTSVYVIGSLCIFCSMVWLSIWTIAATGYTWLFDQKFLPGNVRLQRLFVFVRRNIRAVYLSGFLLVFTVIGTHFWYYWKTLI